MNVNNTQLKEGLDWESRREFQSTFELLACSAMEYPNRVALKFPTGSIPPEEGPSYSYLSLLQQVVQTANMFFHSGLPCDSTIAIALPNYPETIFSLFAAQSLGKSLSINPFLEKQAIAELLNASQAAALVIEIQSHQKTTELLTFLSQTVASLKVVFIVNKLDCPVEIAINTLQVVRFDVAKSCQNNTELTFSRSIHHSDTAAIFHTGGTTGTPKLALLSHDNALFVATIAKDILDLNKDSVSLCGLPLFHVNAVFVTCLNVLYAGGTSVFITPNGFRTPGVVENIWSFIERFNVTYFSAVPTIVSSILANELPQHRSKTLKFVVCGAAPVSQSTLNQFIEKTSVPIIEGYGLTEGTCISSLNPLHGEHRVGSIGVSIPYQQMVCARINDKSEIERFCDFDEQGVILVKGPNIFKGYFNPANNQGVLIDGWLNTGDLGKQDKEGYFWITGRAKDLIIRSGHNIDPKIIEDLLTLHPDVKLAAAIGQPDTYAGELPCAYVMLKEHSVITANVLLDYLKTHMTERAAIPVHVEIIDELPMTTVGKIFKPELRKLATLRVVQKELSQYDCINAICIIQKPNHPLCVEVTCMQHQQEIALTLSKFTFASRVQIEA